MKDNKCHITVLARSSMVIQFLVQGLSHYAQGQSLNWQVDSGNPGLASAFHQSGIWSPEILVIGPGGPDPQSSILADCRGALFCSVPAQSSLPFLWFDDVAVGREAAQHLFEQGWRRGLILSSTHRMHQPPYRYVREESFLAEFRRLGGEAFRFAPREDEDMGPKELSAIIQNLRAQSPDPIALFAYQDREAIWLLQLMTSVGIRIPQDMGIIGCEDTEVAMSSVPALSSVRTSWFLMGRTAANTIQRFLAEGHWILPAPVAPIGVAARDSTRTTRTLNSWMQKAQTLICQSLPMGLDVETLAKKLKVSRETLRRHVQHNLGFSPQTWIKNQRLAMVAKLLQEEPNSTVTAIAKRCGWCGTSHLTIDFHRHFGTSPKRYRLGNIHE